MNTATKTAGKKRYSIRDVAKLAKVSSATVSFVLNDREPVAAATRQAVLSAIAELDYVPLPGGRPRRPRPVRGQTNRIGLLAFGISRAVLNASVYMDVLHGVEAAVSGSGRGLMLSQIVPDTRLPAMVFQQKVDGVVLLCAEESEALIRKLGKTPCVRVMGLLEPASVWDHVTYDNRPVGMLAARHLLERGHRHVATLSARPIPLFNQRQDTFEQAIRAAGGTCLTVVEPNILQIVGMCECTAPEVVAPVVDRLLAATPRPTAVFLCADVLAPGFYNEMLRRGLVPGRDIDIVSCNNEQPLLAHLHHRPAIIDIHAEQIGRKAVEQLLWRLEHPDEPRVAMALDPTLVQEANYDSNEMAGGSARRAGQVTRIR